jgi:hypothetical protein
MDAQQTEGRVEIYYPLRLYAATLEELRAVASAAQLNRHRHTSPFGCNIFSAFFRYLRRRATHPSILMYG